MKKSLFYTFILSLFLGMISCSSHLKKKSQKLPYQKSTLLFSDNGTKNWQEKWMLDGQKAKIIHTKQGMELRAGTEYGSNASHTVLWTKQNFKGNICIEYDYTRKDSETRCVNIIYFHATGKDNKDFPSDISLWNHKRKVPRMSLYYKNMNTYHISYAAFRESFGDKDYIRLRRYNPNQRNLKGTEVPEDYLGTGLFKPDVTYHIQVFKYNNQIEMHIQNKETPSDSLICKWDVSAFTNCESGRIGLRHMYTRNSIYKNFKVWQLK